MPASTSGKVGSQSSEDNDEQAVGNRWLNYTRYVDFGDGENYHAAVRRLRRDLTVQ